MSKWVVLLGVEIFEGFINTDNVVLVEDKEQAEQLMFRYLDEHPSKRVVGFEITKEVGKK